ncbi:ATP-binding protein [Legionella sainthelensi]|uniref:ATP-binding protein n=1 Tax=Legionella sainthelensi TaxID=28087 RepID=UPI0018D50E83|nr:ATP-binding protein [Legionella sainthelensi]
MKDLEKVLSVEASNINDAKFLTIISLRKCNQDIKKILPLLLAKHYYELHKNTVDTPPDKTLHLIIDEAHNILSLQSNREQESWKGYRLELFEEIIKEGRKFGVFLTNSSQRPADISPTIMSQIHNFFIHRLVNDKGLFLLDTTISTLDPLSKGMIPCLSKGCCIITEGLTLV